MSNTFIELDNDTPQAAKSSPAKHKAQASNIVIELNKESGHF
jgi:hypothetical protein